MKRVFQVLAILGLISGSSFALAQSSSKDTPVRSTKVAPRLDASSFLNRLAPDLCAKAKEDPFRDIRSEVIRYREGFNPKDTLDSHLDRLLEGERKDGKDSVELNWIRAIHPWMLPGNSPSRKSFERCAGHLRTISDTWADPKLRSQAISEWDDCVEILYPKEKPAEFEAIRKCLGR